MLGYFPGCSSYDWQRDGRAVGWVPSVFRSVKVAGIENWDWKGMEKGMGMGIVQAGWKRDRGQKRFPGCPVG